MAHSTAVNTLVVSTTLEKGITKASLSDKEHVLVGWRSGIQIMVLPVATSLIFLASASESVSLTARMITSASQQASFAQSWVNISAESPASFRSRSLRADGSSDMSTNLHLFLASSYANATPCGRVAPTMAIVIGVVTILCV